jgi:thiol-disulfide isomerase/thioredoxin
VKRSVIFVLFVVVAITALLFSGKYMSRPAGSANAGFQGANGPAKGTVAPDFTLKLLDGQGKTMQLSSLKGKAVIVNFWATWCDPCKVEMPWLVELQKKYGPQGLQIVGVAVDDAGEKTISDFARKMGVNYPVLLGTEKVADLYGGIDGLPTNFFLDRSGKVVDHVLGLVSESVIEDAIKKSLEQGNTTTASAK